MKPQSAKGLPGGHRKLREQGCDMKKAVLRGLWLRRGRSDHKEKESRSNCRQCLTGRVTGSED